MIKVIVVNVLTSLRVLFSLLFTYYIITYSSNTVPIAIIFIMVCATDYFDGRLARKWMVSTKFGAIFDVIADLFFIIIAYLALIIQNVMPAWILVVVLLKFLEFCVTSSIARKTGKTQNSVFLFDMLGRVVILLLYALPIEIILLENYLFAGMFYPIVSVICFILTIMACISSFYRMKMCLEPICTMPDTINTSDLISGR
ncbi:MAG: CDP-alcohol phosphatidyltransferase family protein [Ruminiclostridium sp.]